MLKNYFIDGLNYTEIDNFVNFVIKNNKKLRLGYTTGSCAAGAAKAAAKPQTQNDEIETIDLDKEDK